MAQQQKFITSHRSRVKRAEEKRKQSPEKISIIDREAYVEFYLLEDIVRLYEYRLENEKKKAIATRAGEMTQKRNIEKFSAVINIFKSVIEIAWGEITSGNYKAVWGSIPEHALMVAANSLKYMPRLRELAVKMLRTISAEAMEATKESADFDAELDAIEDHEANVRRIMGLPTEAEIEELIRSVEIAIPDEKPKATKAKPTTY